MNTFPSFWYESNAYFGRINSIEDLKQALFHQTDVNNCGIFESKDKFLDNSLQNANGSLDFGTRIEHSGTKSLREFLLENNVNIDEL